IGGVGFDYRWTRQSASSERHVRRVASHVAQGPRAEIEPAAPCERVVALGVWPHRGRANKRFPVHAIGNRLLLRSLRYARCLRPNRTIGPDVYLGNLAENPFLYQLYGTAQSPLSRALISHLPADAEFLRCLAHEPRFEYRMCHRLLHVDMFFHP